MELILSKVCSSLGFWSSPQYFCLITFSEISCSPFVQNSQVQWISVAFWIKFRLSICAPSSVATLFLTVSSNILQFLVVNHTVVFQFLYVCIFAWNVIFFRCFSKQKQKQPILIFQAFLTYPLPLLAFGDMPFFFYGQTYSHDNGRHADTMTFFSLYCDTLFACSTGTGDDFFSFISQCLLGAWLIVLISH